MSSRENPTLDDEIRQILVDDYRLCDVGVRECIQTYPTRSVLRVVTSRGDFAVKVDRDPGPLPKESAEVQRALARAMPDHIPRLLSTVDGKLVVARPGLRVTISEDISAGSPPDTDHTWRELGLIVSRMHNLEPAVSRPYAIPVDQAIAELTAQASGYPFGERLLLLLPRLATITSLPSATIHGEINLSNTLRRPDGTIVLTDWDQGGYGPTSLDLGYPLICVFLTEDCIWEAGKASAFYSAYQEGSQLPDLEQIMSAAVLHALRYMRFSNTEQRRKRIEFALAHRSLLTSVLEQTATQVVICRTWWVA